MVATCVGGLVGSLVYELLIAVHHPDPDGTKTTDHLQELEVSRRGSDKPDRVKEMQEQST